MERRNQMKHLTNWLNRLLVMVLFTVLIMLPAAPLPAASNSSVLAGNILGTGVSTVLRSLIMGNIKSFKDVSKCFVYGSVAGLGFYQSKAMAAKGNIFPGVLLANLSASVAENVAMGEGPLDYLGFSFPFVHLQVATPLAKNPATIFDVSFSSRDIASFLSSIKKAQHVSFRNGLLTFTAAEPLSQGVMGWTNGIFPTTLSGGSAQVMEHEAIHAIQNLQLMSVSPEPFMSRKSNPDRDSKILRFSGVRFQAFGLANDLVLHGLQKYDMRWKEIEAYHFSSPVTK
jgi:hypothetical protein